MTGWFDSRRSRSLADSVSQDAVALLASMLKDADPRVRRSAAKALGRRKGAGSLLAPADRS